MRKIVIIATAALLAGGLTGCSTVSTAPDEVALHYGNGFLDQKVLKACVDPSTRQNFNSFADDYFFYPANQRTFDFTGGGNSDRDPFTVVSKDNQQLTVPGSVEFKLNVDCDTLDAFHRKVGARNFAYNTDSGQPTNEGWAKILDLYLGRAVDATLDRVAKQYTWKELYSDPSIKDEMNEQVNKTLADIVNRQFDGDEEFFTGFSSLVQQPQADSELVAALQQEEASRAQAAATEAKAVADANAAKAAAESQVAQKEAELKVVALDAEIAKAKIEPWGDARAYSDFLAIEKGLNPYQPVYIVGGTVEAK